jgi:pilus assembly protein CpaB
VETVQVLVAAADLAQGHVVSEKDLRWQSWPQESINPAFISRSSKPDAMTALAGSMVRSRLVAGEPVQEEKLARTSAGMLASMLPAGKRAVAIRVSAESAAGGFILPNDRVDVIHTLTRAGLQGGSETLGRTLLTNIRVLAIDQRAADVKDPAFIGKTATLELDAEQAEIIAAGQATGTLSLALRSFADFDAAPMVVRAKEVSVRIFHGERSETVRFQ